MKSLDPALLAHLRSGSTTLAWCWRLIRRDGAVLGFTDHDRDLVFDGTTFEAASGFTASEVREEVGLAVDNLEVAGAITSERLSETALAAGDFDDATVEIFRVNWQDPSQRVLVRKGSLGEVKRSGTAFAAEVRGLAHYLQQPKGRLFQFSCDAALGDQRCGVDVTQPAYRATAVVAALADPRRFTTSGLAAFAEDHFTRGLVTFTTGANTGRSMEVKRHTRAVALAAIELWQPLGGPIAAGDAFVITAGCDKRFATCRDRFANAANYRGFPHMPGNDFVTGVARPGDVPRPGFAVA